MKYTQYMRNAAALCGLPVHIWAYRALHSAAFEVHTVCHAALEEKGLRNKNEIAEREHAKWRVHNVVAPLVEPLSDYDEKANRSAEQMNAAVNAGMYKVRK